MSTNDTLNETITKLLPSVVESLMSEYLDLDTYLNLIKYDPVNYTLTKYEVMVVESEKLRQGKNIAKVNQIFICAQEQKYENQYQKKSTLKEILDDQVFETLRQNMEDTFNIMETLGMVKYGGFEETEVFKDYVEIGVNLNGKEGDLTIHKGQDEILFRDNNDDVSNKLILTPLWNLVNTNIQEYMFNQNKNYVVK